MSNVKTLVICKNNITIDEVYDVAFSDNLISLSTDNEFVSRINTSRDILEKKLNDGETVYGVTTGYGDSCETIIPKHLQVELPIRLTRYHQCGLGDNFSFNESRAIQLARIISLSRGYSAIRMSTLQFMVKLFNKGISPVIPQEGSVGASGDLTPLAYYASSLIGESKVYYKNEIHDSADLYKKLSIVPLVLATKEALALMNGTAVMTAISCIVFKRAEYLSKVTSRVTAMASLSLLANSSHFHAGIYEAKPHEGTILAAKRIREDLANSSDSNFCKRLQDRYSIRCAPHIIGVLNDGLINFKNIIEVELNSANDNPLINIETEEILHGGNFYGGHIAFVMDSLKCLIANIADLQDRQMALIVDRKFNNDLPSNLAYSSKDCAVLNHGLKAVQISSSAWTAECLKNTLAASIFSRSTEGHNQDKVSMGTISARDAIRCLRLSSQVCSALVLTCAQAIDIRIKKNELKKSLLSDGIIKLLSHVREISPFIEEDRALDRDLFNVTNMIEVLDPELVS